MPPLGDPASAWSVIGERLLFMSPAMLVQLVGMLAALVFIRGRVGPSVCVLIALGASLVLSVGWVIARELIVREMYTSGRPYEDIRPVVILIDAVQTLVHAVSLALLIVAALAWRKKPQATG